jgi:outer membrane receptor protein involved in Fe transport
MVALESTATLTRGIALDDGAPIDDMPPATFTLGLRRPVSSRGFVQVRGSFFAVDDRPGPTEARMPGYTVVDAIAGATVAKWLDLNLNVRNVLDATYPLSPDPRAVPASGISAVLTANLSF